MCPFVWCLCMPFFFFSNKIVCFFVFSRRGANVLYCLCMDAVKDRTEVQTPFCSILYYWFCVLGSSESLDNVKRRTYGNRSVAFSSTFGSNDLSFLCVYCAMYIAFSRNCKLQSLNTCVIIDCRVNYSTNLQCNMAWWQISPLACKRDKHL